MLEAAIAKLDPGQIEIRKADGWQALAAKPIDRQIDRNGRRTEMFCLATRPRACVLQIAWRGAGRYSSGMGPENVPLLTIFPRNWFVVYVRSVAGAVKLTPVVFPLTTE